LHCRRDVPLILHARDPRRGELVVATDAAASACGVRPGQPLAEAAALVAAQRTDNHTDKLASECQILPHDPAADLAALAKLAEHCERFSPIVGWETVEGGGQSPKSKAQGPRPTDNFGSGTLDVGLFLDVTGIGVLFGGEEALSREVVASLERLGYAGQVAIAGTIGAAWAAAAMQNAECEMQNPESAFRVAALRLPPEMLDLLVQLGIARIEHLLALPRASLRARFGERLLLRLDQLTGGAPEAIVPHRPPPHFAAERVLEYPIEQREAVESLVRELVESIARDLAERREGVVQLHIRLDCAPGQPLLLEVGLFRPSADARHLWEVVRMQLEQKPLPGPVGRVTLEARLTAPLENRQGELFAGNEREAERQYALLIDRLTSRLGAAAVLRAELTADPLPERAMRWVAGVRSQRSGARSQGSGARSQGSGARRKRNAGRQTLSTQYSVLSTNSHREPHPLQSPIRTPQSAVHRPLTLLPPVALEVLSVVPDGPPLTFRWQGRQHQVVRHWGPERIETGWWRGASVRRDYYRVETATGQRFWLFRQLGDGRWQLHGEFS
jgi:protein ImuB